MNGWKMNWWKNELMNWWIDENILMKIWFDEINEYMKRWIDELMNCWIDEKINDEKFKFIPDFINAFNSFISK